ncbi:helix-turn-helix transcriptional regulator [Corynebacterium striatum]
MTKAIRIGGGIPEWRVQDRLKRAREYAGMSQVELADLVGISRATLGNAEQGVRELKRPALIAVAFATGVSLEWLENGETPVGNNPGGGEECAIRDSNPEPTD